ncbi:LON peptidase substrate-binding domain-containing protein [Shewanella sp. OMA3-2]|uniref:LON peptidase substrate-binding domain-containing protein n=1 Tax=Shewanella sp. OMA3-2 TaxID=2908650 RepID=UPI001F34B211|nr:LON peptidase substrate-binding domain-containing protein [Shewanella sp. OMA3-2]UJF20654.1 LON peptidase substrate-binding domain-containing protein [Shewanella sp. OMA3-2]
MIIPIFPLPICILPQGYSQLRIFEARYKRLVTESLKTGVGFGLCMLSDNKKEILPIGTLCKIIDFETLDDGLLGISIRGEKKFVIKDISEDPDGLKRANVDLIQDWPKLEISGLNTTSKLDKHQQCQKALSDTLKDILSEYPNHLALYQQENFQDISWVCQRWLEIIPISAAEKYRCINSHDHHMAQAFLANIIS